MHLSVLRVRGPQTPVLERTVKINGTLPRTFLLDLAPDSPATMCHTTVADDWVLKGCHIKVLGIELAVRPARDGKIVFRSVFSSPTGIAVDAAIRHAETNCLDDPAVRARWVEDIERAKLLLVSFEGDLHDLARGRLAEMHFLLAALINYEN